MQVAIEVLLVVGVVVAALYGRWRKVVAHEMPGAQEARDEARHQQVLRDVAQRDRLFAERVRRAEKKMARWEAKHGPRQDLD
jgi:hypothetical protein